MVTHAHARRLLDTLTGDPDTIAELSRYIEHEASLERLDNPSVARLANAAERRSQEAIDRAVTLTGDVGRLVARIASLEASNRDLGEVLAIIEAR